MELLKQTLKAIEGKNEEAVKRAWKSIDNLSKPIGSLGELENIIAKMAGITGKTHNKIHKKNIVIMCSDNGIWNKSLSSCPKDLTVTVTKNFVRGITGVCVLGDFFKADRTVVDVGVDYDFKDPGIIDKKVAYGTKDMTREPAMTKEECVKAIEAGIEIVDGLVKKGYDMFGAGFQVAMRDRAIAVNEPDSNDPIDTLSKVGGFDIAGICGCFLGAAKNRMPIVIDGFISAVAALCAFRLNRKVVDYIFASHLSAEPAIKYVMKELGLNPMLNLGMRLGEGSGCPMAFEIIEAALYVMDNMGSFDEANIDGTVLVDIRKGK